MTSLLRAQWRQAALPHPLEWSHQGVTLYHGTTYAAAMAIAEQGWIVPDSPTGRGADYGYGVYLTPDKDWARGYARGGLVHARLKPHARVLDLVYVQEAGLTDQHFDTFPLQFWPEFARRHGYHGVTTNGEVVVIYDTSMLEIVGVGR